MQRHIPENFHNHRRENFKSHNLQKFDYILSLQKVIFNVMFSRVTHVCQITATAFADIAQCYDMIYLTAIG